MKLFSLSIIVDKFQKKKSNKLQNIVSSATSFINDKKMKENYKHFVGAKLLCVCPIVWRRLN